MQRRYNHVIKEIGKTCRKKKNDRKTIKLRNHGHCFYLPLSSRLLISNRSIFVHPLENNSVGSFESSELLA